MTFAHACRLEDPCRASITLPSTAAFRCLTTSRLPPLQLTPLLIQPQLSPLLSPLQQRAFQPTARRR